MANSPPLNLSTLFAQAETAEKAGQIKAAQDIYQQILKQQPRNLQAFTLSGLMHIRAGTPHLAITLFEKVLKLEPKSAESHSNLAMLYLHLNRPDRAELHALSAYKINPQSPVILKTLFKCYYHLGKPKKAQTYINKALQHSPNNPEFKLDLAQCYDTTGEPRKAKQLFEELIKQGHGSIYAYDGLVRSQKYEVEPPEYQVINNLISQSSTPPDHCAWLHRAAGKIQDDLGHYDKAFEHFLASKVPQKAKERVQDFDQQVALINSCFTEEFFAKRKNFGVNNKRPVFVFGMPRSGTTLVEQILASHPKVHGANELNYFRDEHARLSLDFSDNESLAASLNTFKRKDAQTIAQEYLKLLVAYSNSAEHVVDKMPLNFEVLWLLALVFPQATFIHCRREAMATCTSCFIQPLGHHHAYAEDLGSLGRYFCLYQDLMAHWKKVLPINILDVDYEQLVHNQEAESKRLITHVDLEWDEACLRFHEVRRDVRTPSRRQVEQPIYTSSLDGWRRYERYLQPLINSLGNLTNT